MSVLQALRAATWESHQRLEKRLDIKTRFGRLDAYRRHLEHMWGFCAAVEQRIDTQALAGALPDYEVRRKLPMLRQDLCALGATPQALAALPLCEGFAPVENPADALGRIYVLEGATLGGRVLLPMVRERLGLDAGRGAAFLASYGEDVDRMWNGFGAALEAWCRRREPREQAVKAAVATFDLLAGWLCREPS